MKKRFLGAAAVAALSVVALASCGGKGVANAGEEFRVLSLNELKGEKINVEFWHSFGDRIERPLATLVDNFEAEMAEQGFDIDVNLVPKGGGYDGLRSQVNLGTKSNSIPTMILGYPDHFADYISNGILLPLDDYAYNSNKDIALEGVTKDGANDFIPSYWAENQMMVKGEKRLVGVPFNKSTEIMTYNSNVVDPILEELGYKTKEQTKWENPTWEQVFAVSQYIQDHKNDIKWTTKAGVEYDVHKDMAYPVYVDSEANFFITVSRQWGGEGNYTVADNNGGGTVVANNPINKAAHEYFLDNALNKHLFQFPKKKDQNFGSKLLINRQAFITIGSTAGIKNNGAENVYELKATGIPQKGYGEGEHPAAIQQGTNLAILTSNSNNKTRLAAWMLIKYLTNTANTEFFSMETGYLPVRQSARETDTFKAFLANENDPFSAGVPKAINAAFSQVDYFYTDAAFKGSSVVRDKLEGLVLDMYIYNKSFDKAMSDFYGILGKLKIKTEVRN